MASRSSHEYIGDTQTNINNMMNREQKLKYLKNDLLLCHSINEYDHKYDQNIERLKECVSSQEIKLRQLRALKAQVNKQTNNNANIRSELESIRTVFNEKEKELAVALTKVDSLTRQLEELRKGNTTNSYQISEISNGKHAAELEKLRQELLYRSKLSEQQNQEILQKKGLLTQRQSEMVHIDKRIVELQQRLARKRQLNQHLTQMHCSGNGVYGDSNVILRSAINANAGHSHKSVHSRPLSANIAAVEPLQREQNRINENDDLLNKNQDFSGCKLDPKYQTLPYNTKFNLRQLQRMSENHLMESKLEAIKNEYESAKEIYAINNNLAKNIANNSYNGTELMNGNSNSKLINFKQSYLEERPSPSGSSGSSDRASIQSHNSSQFYKMQSSIVNSNFALNANQQKLYNTPYLENDNLKHSKSVNLINNRNMQNINQNLSHNYRVPTVSQTQSYVASNSTKVPHLTLNKSKPILPPKPSIPVKPTPPPRQTPNHSMNAQSENHDSVDNSFSFYEINANINNYARKTANLLKTNATQNLNQNYGPSLGVQKGCDGSNDLLIQSSLSNKQQSSVFEDKTLNSFNAELGNETTDGCNINGQSVMGCDTNSSTSSLSSISVNNNSNNHNNNVRSNSSINNINSQTACADKENYSNASKSYNNCTSDDLLRNNNNNLSNKNSGLNNLMLDWHKVKRRPFIADNKLEQELAIHSAIPNSFADNKLVTQFDLSSESQSSSLNEDNTAVSCDTFQNKPEENSKVDAKFIQEPRDINLDRFESNENNKENLCDKEQNNDELSCLPPKCIGGVKRTKGNLKSQQITIGDHIGISRRVSFDPLALLLDAALEGELELVKKTAAEVPNASAANDEGITALHNSICAGHSDIVNYLVENGCDVNAQDSDGWTPLHCAASCNNLAMVKFLVEHGACIFATTLSDQETAAEKCEEDEEGFDGCSQYLYGIQEKLGIMNSGVVYAVYDYDSQNADELSFSEGEKITVLRKGDDQEREWWWSKLKDREGYVPRNLIGLYPRVRGEKLKSFNLEQNE